MITNLLYLIVPLFGLIVPYSLFSLLPNVLAIGLVYGMIVRERFHTRISFVSILIFSIFSLLYLARWPDERSVLAIIVFILSYIFSITFLAKKKLFVFLVLSVLIFGLFLTGLTEGRHIITEVSHEPGVEYTTDMRAFLKTYYLMKNGENYYPAFAKGVSGAEGTGFGLDIGGWREPFIFYLWKYLTVDGSQIYFLSIIFFSINLLASYSIARQFLPEKTAILAPLLLWSYFHYPMVDLTYMQMEWWAMSFFLWGLAFYFSTKKNYSGIFFALSLATRELFIFSIATIMVIKLSRRHFRSFVLILLPLLCFFVFYVLVYIPNLIPYETVFLRTAGYSDLHMINRALAYSSWSYLLGIYRPLIILFALTTTIAIWRVIRGTHSVETIRLMATYLPFSAVIFLAAGSGRMTMWNDYWGIYIIPALLTVTPIILFQATPGKLQEPSKL